MDTILTTLVAAVALGIAGQIIAERFQLPAILPLLVFGILCGPFGLGIVHPEALGDVRLGHCDQLVLLVKEGRPLEILEPFDMSNLEVINETEKVAADNESGPDIS